MKVSYYSPLHLVMHLSTAAEDLHVDHSRSTLTWCLLAGQRTELKSPHTGFMDTEGVIIFLRQKHQASGI